MNPLMQLLVIALAAFAVVLVLALTCSVFILSAGKRYSEKMIKVLQEEIMALMPGKECENCLGCQQMVEKMLDEEMDPHECSMLSEENAQKITSILEEYRAEQERIRKTSEENRNARPQRRRILKFLTEKKDKGEWL